MDTIVTTPIIEEVEQSFLDYSLSVITDRAIPAVEDGLKPVMRRILWEMQEDGVTSGKQYVKCATPVGNTMAKYHPHGDSSIYGALVHSSQPWTMRYPLIDFHGNNGSRDGDGPAAYRYTECRLSPIAESTLEHIKENTVDWLPNYSETGQEPVYLPGRFPNLICNGTTGIAVAMACSFAPHNLSEVMNAIIAYAKDAKISDDDLLSHIPGPDFPTGGLIVNKDELRAAYLTGKGRARIRGEYKVETRKGKGDVLVFTSIPYKISKENLIEEIDNLCEEKKLEGIVEIRDESNKEGVRFVIELAKGINADVIANKLYRLTELETTYSFNQVALVNKTPKLITFREMLHYYLEHQKDVFYRRCDNEYRKLLSRLHILAGLITASEDIDNVIVIIRKAENVESARVNLKTKYKLDDDQVKAILDMKLSKLTHMEKIALESERDEKQARALYLENLLKDEVKRTAALIDDLEEFKKTFSKNDVRRTTITQLEIKDEDKEIAEIMPEACVVVITEAGNIKRIPTSSYRTQKRNGKGVKNQDEVTHSVIKTNTIDALMVFSTYGKVYRLPVNDVPVGTNATRGTSIETLVSMESNEKFVTLASVEHSSSTNQYVWFFTKHGLVKKTGLAEYTGMKRKSGIVALGLREGDALAKVFIGPDSEIVVLTSQNMSLRFNGNTVGATSRTSTGVKAINLADGDEVVTAIPVDSKESMIGIFFEDGTAKRVPLKEFTLQGRGGKGLKCSKSGKIVDGLLIAENDTILVTNKISSICIAASDISTGTRASQGVIVIKGNNVVKATRIN